MNKLAKLAVVVAGLALVSQVANAANNDIVLGFTGNGAANDYIIDLGSATTSVGVNSGSVHDLSSLFNLTTFNSTFSSVNGTLMGAGGGAGGLNPDAYLTQNRGAAGDASTALSAIPTSLTSSGVANVAGYFNAVIGGNSLTAGGSVTPTASGSSSFTSLVNAQGTPSVKNDTGITVSSAIGSSTIYEDLWFNNKGTGWTYKGFFTFDDSGSSPLLTFTAVPVPEPSTYGLFGGAGILALAMRRQFRNKTA